MKVIYTGKKTYALKDDRDHTLGTLKFLSHFSLKAVIEMNNETTELAPKKWCSKVRVVQNATEQGLLDLKWNGMSIQLNKNGSDETFWLKRFGFWKAAFVLLDSDKAERLKITPVFRWKTMRYDYEIQPHQAQRFAVDPQTMLICAYCINYINVVTAVAAT